MAKNPDSAFDDARFRLAFDRAPIGLAIVGADYRLQRVNSALSEALGYTQDELLTRSFVELTHPDDIHRDTELADKLFRGELPSYRIEKRFLNKHGKLVWLDVSAFIIRDPSDQMLYGLAMVQDITERRDSEAALRTSEERYRSFVVNSSEAIWRFEIKRPIPIGLPVDEQIEAIYSQGYLAECNDAMARLYGRDRAEDILGAPLSNFISLTNDANHASLRTFVTNHYRLHNSHAIAPDAKGGERHFSSSIIGIALNGFLLRIWGTQRDETLRWQAEDELMRSREQLRSLAAHLQNLREHERCNLSRELHDDLGQSLTSLKLDLFRIARQLEQPVDDKLQQQITGRLELAMELIEKMLGQVKAISTELRPGVLDKFGLTAAIEWQCAEFERRSGIKCECSLPSQKIRLLPEQSTALFRILQEALGNVARHSNAANVMVTLLANESEVALSVLDNGRGITPAEVAAPDSLGLLGMCERAEMLGGSFHIEGAPGHTLLSARLPIVANA